MKSPRIHPKSSPNQKPTPGKRRKKKYEEGFGPGSSRSGSRTPKQGYGNRTPGPFEEEDPNMSPEAKSKRDHKKGRKMSTV